MKEIDFANLTPMDALDLAILVEEEACERYEELSAQMATHDAPAAAEFFAFMVANEAKHGEELMLRRRKQFGSVPARVERSMLWNVEAPDYSDVRPLMPARAALMVALEAEVKAHRFFVEAMKEVGDPDVRALFEELSKEELVHQDLVRHELAKLPVEASVERTDYEDEPVPQ